ncbi:MAG: 50S ribosomal protein L24 [Myxococcales bacterium]|nr:50S ribosomal protein L24 [Myxococcales bacterium]
MPHRLKRDDQVVVVAGKDKGARGKILKVFLDRDRVIVEGVNRVKRHQRPTQTMPQGGIIEKEMPIHVSNVMLLDPKEDKPTRVRVQTDKEGKRVRVAARSGAVLDS